MHTRGDRRGRSVPAGLLCALLMTTVLLGAFSLPASAAGGDDRKGGVDVVGKLPEPSEMQPTHITNLIDVDEKRHRLLYLWRAAEVKLREYDTSTGIPRLLREETLGDPSEFQLDFSSPYTIAVDRVRHLAVLQSHLDDRHPGQGRRPQELQGRRYLGSHFRGPRIPGRWDHLLPGGRPFVSGRRLLRRGSRSIGDG